MLLCCVAKPSYERKHVSTHVSISTHVLRALQAVSRDNAHSTYMGHILQATVGPTWV
jgi:hypothetical protein